MSITMQFANSPIGKKITRKTVSASGTVTALLTGSASLMWRARTNGGNGGEVRLSTSSVATQFWTLEAGDDTGWLPGNVQDYWFYGTQANDELAVWELY